MENQLERRTPSETSSRKMSRLASPDTMMNHLQSLLSGGVYDGSSDGRLSDTEQVCLWSWSS